jgi:ParB/RepB/Spo0J family partition protein
MRIALSLIRESSQKVRNSWDEEALNELAQSIREQGVIVPVKVRPTEEWKANCPRQKETGKLCVQHQWEAEEKYGTYETQDVDRCPWCQYVDLGGENLDEGGPVANDWKPFELVYGHRRTEAARRAGLEEIEAIVEGMEDTDALIQALIENVMREDLAPMDTARGLQALIDATGWSQHEIDRHGIMNFRRVSEMLALLTVTKEVQDLVAGAPGGNPQIGTVTEGHVRVVRRAASNDDGVVTDVIKKAAHEGLTMAQSQQVAESIVKAKNPEHRESLLRTPYSSFLHNPEYVEANERAFVAGQPSPQRTWNESPTAKALVTVFTTWDKTMADMVSTASIGKLAPEAIRFIANQLRRFAEKLLKRAGELEGLANENLA